MKEVRRYLENYGKYILFKINKEKSIEYFKRLQSKYSIKYFKKQVYYILKFLKQYNINWVNEIKLPSDPDYTPKRVTSKDMSDTIEYFRYKERFKRHRALILLGYTSGLRAEELFKLTSNDVDLNTRTVYVRHDPKNNHSTKTGKSRISFFTFEARDSLYDYLIELKDGNSGVILFPQRTIERSFKDSPILVKDLRKFFSQEWDRRGGPTGIKKILMGHSIKRDVDLMHYNCQSEEDLKRIYDKVIS